MIEDVTPDVVYNVGRAVRDPMIGGWPLIHWEWLFSTDGGDAGPVPRHARGIEVIGAWPDSEDRLVTFRYHPATGVGDVVVNEGYALAPDSA
jgi:hypothetical protein